MRLLLFVSLVWFSSFASAEPREVDVWQHKVFGAIVFPGTSKAIIGVIDANNQAMFADCDFKSGGYSGCVGETDQSFYFDQAHLKHVAQRFQEELVYLAGERQGFLAGTLSALSASPALVAGAAGSTEVSGNVEATLAAFQPLFSGDLLVPATVIVNKKNGFTEAEFRSVLSAALTDL